MLRIQPTYYNLEPTAYAMFLTRFGRKLKRFWIFRRITLILASTPSLDIEATQESSEYRRNSTGTLLSPDAEGGVETDGFYLLKKDSQRRQTLTKVLSQDGSKICDLWMQKIKDKNQGQIYLTVQHLAMLMEGFKSYLTETSTSVIENIIGRLKEEFHFAETAINQLELAVYIYQEAVIEVLRSHPIKPHWMFALDNLVRASVQAAITVISPELGENLANNSSPSTINSSKSSKGNESFEIPDQILQLRTEHNRLIQDMLEVHKQLLCSMTQLVENTNSLKHCSCHTKETLPEDPELRQWLNRLGVNEVAQNKVLAEGYTLDEIRQHVTRDDLKKLNLRGSSELRIWLGIYKYRTDWLQTTNNSLNNGNIY